MPRCPRFALLLAFLAGGCGGPTSDRPEVDVEHAIVTLPAVAGRPGAAYFTLEAYRDGIRLLGVSSPRARRAEMHEAGMRPAAEILLPVGRRAVFAPGGRHVMLFDLDPALRPGDIVPLRFSFAGATDLTAEAEARRPGDVHGGH
jgi:periplasmic copper chaperone A